MKSVNIIKTKSIKDLERLISYDFLNLPKSILLLIYYLNGWRCYI